MPPSSDPARVADNLATLPDVQQLAVLYDRFANALDPFDPGRDQAERVFMQELVNCFELIEPGHRPKFEVFRGAMVIACRRFLAAANRQPPSVPPTA